MNSLIGTVFQAGIVEFLHEDNPWAFEAIKRNKGDVHRVPRVVVDPRKAPIELTLSPRINPDDCPWIDHLQELLLTADKVFLKPDQQALRLAQAVHDFGNHRQLITLGSQKDIDEFASKYWARLKYFYANRHDEFRFNLGKAVTFREGNQEKTDAIELHARIASGDHPDAPHITFDATGSTAPVQIVEWRNQTRGKDHCRFSPEGYHIQLQIAAHRRPLTFFHEYREEFKNHAFEFEGEKLNRKLKRIKTRLEATDEQVGPG